MADNPLAERTPEQAVSFIRDVLSINDTFSLRYDAAWERTWWRTDGEYAPVTFFVNCNDLFWWATADCETLTPENLHELPRAVADVRSALGVEELARDCSNYKEWNAAGGVGADLFCARVRKMRPQRPFYERLDPRLVELFDACGPERDPREEG